MGSMITDGTGTGYKAAVSEFNRLRVDAISEDVFVHAAEEGDAFNINTETITVTGVAPFSEDVLYVKNNETSDVEIVGWFIGEKNRTAGGGNATEPLLFEMYGYTGDVTGGTAVSIVNRKIGSPKEFDLTALKQIDTVTTQGSPLLYQYHYGGRAFGTVNFTIPSGGAIVLRVGSEADTVNLYTGFTGYVRGSSGTK